MSVTLWYHGHRKTVPVSPSMIMNDVLNQGVESFELKSANIYQLNHEKQNVVDLSLPFRLTGLPKNASLEITLKKTEGFSSALEGGGKSIRVLVQDPEGRRNQGSFSSKASMMDILMQLQIQPSDQMTLVFVRKEIENASFGSTTLQDLGVVSGSASFRIQLRGKSGTSALQSSAIEPSHNLPPFPPETSKRRDCIQSSDEMDTKAIPPPPSTILSSYRDEVRENVQISTVDDALETIRQNSFDAAAKDTVLMLMKIICNLLSKPDHMGVRSINVDNPLFNRNVGSVRGGVEFLEFLGFTQREGYLVLDIDQEDTPTLQRVFQRLHQEADELSIEAEQRPIVKLPQQPDLSFDPYKTIVTRPQNLPRGKSEAEKKVEELKEKTEKMTSLIIPPRDVRVFYCEAATREDSTVQPSMPSELDSNGDRSVLLTSMKHRMEEAEKKSKFSTHAMRELEKMSKQKVYQQAVVRIHFPDRVILQAHFHPKETVSAVTTLVINHLKKEFRDIPFSLYVSPPKLILEDQQSLLSQGLVPAAKVHLSWQCECSSKGAYLVEELLHSLDSDSKTETTYA